MAVKLDLNRTLLDELFKLYTTAEVTMLEKIAENIKKGLGVSTFNQTKLVEIQKVKKEIRMLIDSANRSAKAEISNGLIKAYMIGKKSAEKDLGKPVTSTLSSIVPAQVQRLILETNNLIDGTSFQILRNVDDIYRKIISETSTGVMVGTDTRVQAAQKALNNFAAAGVTGFVDSIGRRWDVSSYVEMATRATTAHAALQGHVDRMQDFGHDLVIVSSFGNTCLICAPWEGKILSIKGGSMKYPSLDSAKAAGLFHPNCKHTVTAYFEHMDDEPHKQPHKIEYDPWTYAMQQQQRYNERQIRMWKRREAVALDDVSQRKASTKVKEWQAIQREHLEATGLRRKYGRENPKIAR